MTEHAPQVPPTTDTEADPSAPQAPEETIQILGERRATKANIGLHVNGLLNSMEEKARTLGVSRLACHVLQDNRFKRWSGASRSGLHHYGDYGLVIHTFEVVQTCMELRRMYRVQCPAAAMFLAALYHDYGKIFDYCKSGDGEWGPTDHKNKIYHVSQSAIFWNKCFEKSDGKHFMWGTHEANTELWPLKDEVTHAILSHHGQPDWGSPIRPQTKMAWILHLSDMLSARLNDGGE